MAKHLRLFPFVGLHARAVLPQRPAPPGVRPPPQEERKGFFGRPEVPRARTLRRRLGSAPDCLGTRKRARARKRQRARRMADRVGWIWITSVWMFTTSR